MGDNFLLSMKIYSNEAEKTPVTTAFTAYDGIGYYTLYYFSISRSLPYYILYLVVYI